MLDHNWHWLSKLISGTGLLCLLGTLSIGVFGIWYTQIFQSSAICIAVSVTGMLIEMIRARCSSVHPSDFPKQFLAIYFCALSVLLALSCYTLFRYHWAPSVQVELVSLGLCSIVSPSVQCIKVHARSPRTNMSERVLVRLARHDRQATGIVPKDIQEYEMQCERHCRGIGITPSFAIELTDLEPHVEYKYVVVATQTGANATLGSGTLHTWNLQTPQAQHCLSGTDCDSRASVGDTIERGQLRFASSSCVMTGRGMFERPIQVFKTIPKHNVDLFLFLGDSQYSDVPSGRHLGTNNHLYDVRYQELLNHPSFRELVQNVPVVWQYDDHEIQDNYAEGAESPVFYTAYNAWKEHLGYMNPLQSLNHTYFRDQHTCDDFDNTDESCFAEDHTVVGTLSHSRISFVQGIAAFYICDTRMFQNEEDSTMIGKEQLEDVLDWICEPLPKDVAVKFLVSPQPWTLNYLSGWSMYPEERSRVLDRIEECHMIGKVILISGDQHRPAVYVVRENLIEISVSPVDATASAIQGLDHRTVQHDKVLLEAKGFTEAFALFDIIQDNGGDITVKVTVVAGGKDFGVESIEYILASIATFVFCIWFARSCPGDCSLLWLGALFLGGELLIHVTAKYELETVFQLDIPILR